MTATATAESVAAEGLATVSIIEEPGPEIDVRVAREREFHDQTFRDNARESASKFYAIAGESTAFCQRYLQARCSGRDLLEYGCGEGSYSIELAGRASSVTAIDISPVAIEHAGQMARELGVMDRVRLRVMNAEALEFDDASFDLISGTGILHHLVLQKAFAEIARTLRPGGSALFVEPLAHNPLINLYRRLTPGLRTEDEHPLTVDDFVLARRYFGTVETHFFHLGSLLAVPFRRTSLFPPLLGALHTADRMLFRLLPAIRKYAWMVVLILAQPRAVHPRMRAAALDALQVSTAGR
jgi:SAM-dependent methyltransferase